MPKFQLPSLLLASVVGLASCGGDSDAPTSSSDAPINQTFAIFNPATSDFPITNDLLFGSETAGDGTMNAGTDPSNPVISGIDALDGRSVSAPFDIKFSGSLDGNQSIDAASFVVQGQNVIPNPNQNIFLLPLAYPSGDGLSQASINGSSVEIPTFADALAYQTAATTMDVATLTALATPTVRAEIISLDDGIDNVLRITPLKPLMPKTKYLVVVTSLQDRMGNQVNASSSYDLIRDPATNFDQFGPERGPRLAALRPAIQGWEQLAAGYFGFMEAVFAAGGAQVPVPSADDIIFSMTFTTAGTTDVLKYVTAPETFFSHSIADSAKKDAIVKVVSGVIGLNGATEGGTDNDAAVAMTLNFLLTSPTLVDESPNPLYNATIAGAIDAGADYATIVGSDASAGYLIQRAATEAALSVANSGNATIAQQGMGTVQAIAEAAGAAPSDLFPIPAPRTTNFYRMDSASEINPALVAPATVYQGEITLPYYQMQPTETDFSPIQTGSWQASATIGGILDAANGNEAGTTPPSSMVTYRYPFPTKQSDVTVPMLAVTPVAATLQVDGYTVPEKWPTIIFSHGITSDRSTTLPMANALANACVVRDPNTGAPVQATGLPCFAVVVIDQTLHGIAPGGSVVPGLMSVNDPDYATTFTANVGDNQPSASLTERHFNLTADAASSPMAMDYMADVGSSGSLFVNLTNFTNVRDNMRQFVLDLLNVNASIAGIDVNDDGVMDLDENRVYFLGHSLGGLNGMPFVAINNLEEVQQSPFNALPKVRAASAMFSGGGIPKLLINSQSFSTPILQGLAGASEELVHGNSSLETYFNVFQGVLDSVDVLNFAGLLSDANSDTGILLTLAEGDTVIPNAADDKWGTPPLSTTTSNGFVIDNFPAPLAGSEPMIAEFGAIKTAEIVEPESFDGDPEVLITRFIQGGHGTPVSADPLPVFMELASELAVFFAIDGMATTQTPILMDASVIEE